MQHLDTEFHALTRLLAGLERGGLPADQLYSILDSLPVAIPPFLRALLIADGTVTMLLEAYFGETVRIRTVTQESSELTHPVPLLGICAGHQAFFRKVELTGAVSSRLYATAHTLLNPSVIEPELFRDLVTEHVGIGWILRNSAKGSFREVLQISAGGLSGREDRVNRSYLVRLEGTPALMITEEFPLEPYRA